MKKTQLLLIFLLISNLCFSQYYTGQRVFSNKFPSEIKDYNQDTYLMIDNTCRNCNDIIVAVEDIYNNRVIQHAYINSGDSYKFKSIPVGSYVCKYMWTDVLGKRRYEKDNKTMTYKAKEYGGYVITLEETVYGNLSQSSISENEFFD